MAVKEDYLNDPEGYILAQYEIFLRRQEDATRRYQESMVNLNGRWAIARDLINRWAGIYGKPTTYEVIDRELNKQR